MDEEGVAPEWLKNFDWVHDYQTKDLNQEKIDRVESTLIDFSKQRPKGAVR